MKPGDRVRLRTLGHEGVIERMLPTPDYGPVPMVLFDDWPHGAEPHGIEELEVIEEHQP
jgi:hypothetical protein